MQRLLWGDPLFSAFRPQRLSGVQLLSTILSAFLPLLLREVLERSLAQAAGPAIASMLIYVLMAVVLAIRPQGLFPVRHG